MNTILLIGFLFNQVQNYSKAVNRERFCLLARRLGVWVASTDDRQSSRK